MSGLMDLRARHGRLTRLLGIRALQAQRELRVYQMAASAVAEVENALAAGREHAREAVSVGRLALEGGEREDWLFADAQREVTGWEQARLAGLKTVREAVIPESIARMTASRLEHEQVKALLETTRAAALVAEDRRMQAAADDWFLSRRASALRRAVVKAL